MDKNISSEESHEVHSRTDDPEGLYRTTPIYLQSYRELNLLSCSIYAVQIFDESNSCFLVVFTNLTIIIRGTYPNHFLSMAAWRNGPKNTRFFFAENDRKKVASSNLMTKKGCISCIHQPSKNQNSLLRPAGILG